LFILKRQVLFIDFPLIPEYKGVMPISDCDVRDPRIRRTRTLLQESLRKLLQSNSFDEITVQDITDAATVNRATFYDHYTDKYDLLEAMVAGGFHKLLHDRKVTYDGSCAGAAGPIVRATCDYLCAFHSDQDACRKQTAFEPLIEAAIVNAIRRILLAGIKPSTFPTELKPEMIATTASWAIYGAVKEWFNTAGRPSADAIVPIILRMVVPVLESSGVTSETDK
jgi:AcrR family transcriptional regulator